MKHWFLPGIVMIMSLAPHETQASPPDCSPNGQNVALEAEPSALFERVALQLAAALAARDIVLCRANNERPAKLGRITLQQDLAHPTEIVISVQDAVTDKRLERTLSLSPLPEDSWALAIASSADELLRASWVELALPDAPAPVVPPTAAVRQVVQETRARHASTFAPAARNQELALQAVASLLPTRAALGAKLRAEHWFSPRWSALLAAGFDAGLRRESQHGSVRADSLVLEAGAAYCPPLPLAPFGVALEASASLLRMSFLAQANADAEAQSFSDYAVMVHTRLRAFLDTGRLRTSLSVGAIYGLRPTQALDGSQVVTGDQGVGMEVLTAIGVMP